MADIILEVTIPDAKVDAAIEAIKLNWVECVEMTNAQIKTYVEERLFNYLKQKLIRAKRHSQINAISTPDIL